MTSSRPRQKPNPPPGHPSSSLSGTFSIHRAAPLTKITGRYWINRPTPICKGNGHLIHLPNRLICSVRITSKFCQISTPASIQVLLDPSVDWRNIKGVMLSTNTVPHLKDDCTRRIRISRAKASINFHMGTAAWIVFICAFATVFVCLG
jgi:hypothetical protein